MSIKNNWFAINERVAAITDREVTVLAVTKRHSVEEIREVIAAGARFIGENRVDEACDKFVTQGLLDNFPNIRLHFIGHLQRRAVKDAVKFFDCIQSVESEKLAIEIDKRCAAIDKKMDVLIEVNVSGESQKFGVAPEDAAALAEKIIQLENLNLKGLMTMAPFTDNEKILRSTFSGLRILSEKLAFDFGKNYFQTLSMGMSNDFEIAVEEGSTMIRVGTALFAK